MKYRKFLSAMAALVCSVPALGGTEPIRSVKVAADGAQTFRQFQSNGQPVSFAACATARTYVILDENSVAGRAQMALLVLASALPDDKSIRVVGLGTCTRLAGHEDVDFIEIP